MMLGKENEGKERGWGESRDNGDGELERVNEGGGKEMGENEKGGGGEW